jgi:hypothetical protein
MRLEELQGMNVTELFPTEQITVKSPRLLWMERHGVKTSETMAGECPETGFEWLSWVAYSGELEISERDRVGIGETEDDAIADWARINGVRLWNEDYLK